MMAVLSLVMLFLGAVWWEWEIRHAAPMPEEPPPWSHSSMTKHAVNRPTPREKGGKKVKR